MMRHLYSRIIMVLALCGNYIKKMFFEIRFFNAESKHILKNVKRKPLHKRSFRHIGNYHASNIGVVIKTDFSKKNYTLISYQFFNKILKKIITQTIPFARVFHIKPVLVRRDAPVLVNKGISFKSYSIKESVVNLSDRTNDTYLKSDSIFNCCSLDTIVNTINTLNSEQELTKIKSKI